MVEHSTADREVPGSNPGAPSFCIFLLLKSNVIHPMASKDQLRNADVLLGV